MLSIDIQSRKKKVKLSVWKEVVEMDQYEHVIH